MVSIVLPTYNGQKYIRESIQSIIQQTYEDWELIIIDDCSTDDTNKIAREYERLDKRIRVIKNDKNLRLPASLNKGFNAARGEFLTWTSDDNLYKNNAIERLVKSLLENRQYGMVFSRMEYIDANGKSKGFSSDITNEKELYYHNIVGASFMYTRRVYEEIGDYNIDKFLMEDYDYWLRILKVAKIKYLPEILYQYRQHEGSLTETRNRQMLEGKIELLKEQLMVGQLDKETCRMIYKELAEASFSLDQYHQMKEYFNRMKKINPNVQDVRKAVRISCIIGPTLSVLIKRIMKRQKG